MLGCGARVAAQSVASARSTAARASASRMTGVRAAATCSSDRPFRSAAGLDAIVLVMRCPHHAAAAPSLHLVGARPAQGAERGAVLEGSVVGGVGGGGTPGPIPNPEAKPSSADGTALVRVWESRSPPTFNMKQERGPAGKPAGLLSFSRLLLRSPPHRPADLLEPLPRSGVPVGLLLRDRPARPRSPRPARCRRRPWRTGLRSCRGRARTSAHPRRRSRPRGSTRARRHPPARGSGVTVTAPVNLRNHSSTRPFRSSATLSGICDQDRSPDRRSHVTGFPSLHRMERGTGPLGLVPEHQEDGWRRCR